MKDNISIETFSLIAKAGIVIGQANPRQDVNTLVQALVNEFIKRCANV